MKYPAIIWIIAVILICCTAVETVQADEPVDSLLKANTAFSEANYQEAIDGYRQILVDYGLSAPVLHNLGNSYLATGNTGLAILQYMRGLRIAPGDDDLISDLELVRKEKGLFEHQKSWRERFFTLLDLNGWLILALASYGLLTLLLALPLFVASARVPMIFSILLASTILTASLGAYHQYGRWYGGIVVQPDTRLLLSPFATAATVGVLEEGMMVFSEKEHGGFQYVRDESGRAGWIPTNAFETIPVNHLRYSQVPAARERQQL